MACATVADFMSAATPAISIKNLTKVFRTPTVRKQFVTAVRELSLEVAPGQIYGLIGPNGSGKSTTMKVLLGLLKPTAGTAAIFGRDSSRVESRNDVGFLPENPYFYKHLTGVETLSFYGKLCGLHGADLRDRIGEMLALVDLEHARDRRLGGIFQGHAAAHRTGAGVDSPPALGGARRTDGRRRSSRARGKSGI